jgi:hypothetical protein
MAFVAYWMRSFCQARSHLLILPKRYRNFQVLHRLLSLPIHLGKVVLQQLVHEAIATANPLE